MNKLNGRKVVALKIVTWVDPYAWNYGGTKKHRGIEYRAGSIEGCWEKNQYWCVRRLIMGVQRFQWVWQKHPTKAYTWWWFCADVTPPRQLA